MNIAFQNGVSGLIAYQKDMDTLAHNMANVNTVGYKGTRTSFSDLVYTNMNVHHNYEKNAAGNTGAPTDPAVPPATTPPAAAKPGETTPQDAAAALANKKFLVGHGVRGAYLDLVFAQGGIRKTEMPLDFALTGDGLFAIDRGGAVKEYTRNGTFDISLEGSKGYLVSSDGGYVLDAKGKKIALDHKAGTKTFNLDNLKDKIGVYTFSNPYGLEQTTGSSFLETTISGPAKAASAKKTSTAEAPYTLLQGALESSSVDVAEEMVNVMTTQKAFQINGKIVQTADQMEEIINNLR